MQHRQAQYTSVPLASSSNCNWYSQTEAMEVNNINFEGQAASEDHSAYWMQTSGHPGTHNRAPNIITDQMSHGCNFLHNSVLESHGFPNFYNSTHHDPQNRTQFDSNSAPNYNWYPQPLQSSLAVSDCSKQYSAYWQQKVSHSSTEDHVKNIAQQQWMPNWSNNTTTMSNGMINNACNWSHPAWSNNNNMIGTKFNATIPCDTFSTASAKGPATCISKNYNALLVPRSATKDDVNPAFNAPNVQHEPSTVGTANLKSPNCSILNKSENNQNSPRIGINQSNLELPFSSSELLSWSRAELEERLKAFALSEGQLELLKRMRRRDRNRLAAQNCRMRRNEKVKELKMNVELISIECKTKIEENQRMRANLEKIREEKRRLNEQIFKTLGKSWDEIKNDI